MYFNQRFDVSAIKMRNLGVFNPEYGVDNRMFVDPKLLENAKEEFAGAHDDLHAYYRKTIEVLKISQYTHAIIFGPVDVNRAGAQVGLTLQSGKIWLPAARR